MKKAYISPLTETQTPSCDALICLSPLEIIEQAAATEEGAKVDGEDYGNGGVGLVKGQYVNFENEW